MMCSLVFVCCAFSIILFIFSVWFGFWGCEFERCGVFFFGLCFHSKMTDLYHLSMPMFGSMGSISKALATCHLITGTYSLHLAFIAWSLPLLNVLIFVHCFSCFQYVVFWNLGIWVKHSLQYIFFTYVTYTMWIILAKKTNLLLTAPKPTNFSISWNTYIVHTMIIPSNYNYHSPVAHIRPWVLPRPQPCKPFAISPNLCWQHWIRPTRPPHDGSPACRAWRKAYWRPRGSLGRHPALVRELFDL